MFYYEVRYRRSDRMDLHTEWSAFHTQQEAQEHLRQLRSQHFIAHMRPISEQKYRQRLDRI